jgi:hypothetical protein
MSGSVCVRADTSPLLKRVDPLDLASGAQMSGDRPHVSFDLEVDGLAARVSLCRPLVWVLTSMGKIVTLPLTAASQSQGYGITTVSTT